MPMSRVSVGGGFVVSDYFDVAGKTTVFSCSRFVIISCEIIRPVIITNGTQMSSLFARLFSVRIDLN